jgi:hypothetical protein
MVNESRYVKTCFYLLIIPIGFVFSISIIGCSKSDNGPTQSNQGSWTISGKTYAVGSLDPLPGVVVKCAGQSATSGADGSYKLQGIPAGTQILTAEKAGTEIYSRSIEINSDLTFYVYLTIKITNLMGYVTNSVDGPIIGAKVVMLGLVDYTDISGQYLFSNIPQGSGTLSISHPRYTAHDTVLSLTSSSLEVDVALTRDSVMVISTSGSAYVDESLPAQVMPVGSQYRLYLRDNGYDSTGVYRSAVRRFIYVYFNFPQIFNNQAVTIVEANLQLCTDGPYAPSGFQTYSLTSPATFPLTFNHFPATGSLLTSGTIGDLSSAKYWTVLDVAGFAPLLAQWRTTGLIYGIMIQGGRPDPISFFSVYGPSNPPKITFKVRY